MFCAVDAVPRMVLTNTSVRFSVAARTGCLVAQILGAVAASCCCASPSSAAGACARADGRVRRRPGHRRPAAPHRPQQIRPGCARKRRSRRSPVPAPASSGKTNRHRLNRAGDRQANSAPYHIVMVRRRYDQATKRPSDQATKRPKNMSPDASQKAARKSGDHPLPQALRGPSAVPAHLRSSQAHQSHCSCLTPIIGVSRWWPGGSAIAGVSCLPVVTV